MSESITPIKTDYNGIQFRSRLEARWAVFFDAVGVKYEYEPDSFMIGGIRYIPDFYLPDLKQYVEVKPYRAGAFMEVAKTLGIIGTGKIKSLLVLSNFPEETNMAAAYPAVYAHPVSGNIVVEWCLLGKSPRRGFTIAPLCKYFDIDKYSDNEEIFFKPMCKPHSGEFRGIDLHECYTKAKGYRFD